MANQWIKMCAGQAQVAEANHKQTSKANKYSKAVHIGMTSSYFQSHAHHGNQSIGFQQQKQLIRCVQSDQPTTCTPICLWSLRGNHYIIL